MNNVTATGKVTKGIVNVTNNRRVTLYDCGICGSLHPWLFRGDCRDDANRYDGIEDYTARTGINEFAQNGALLIEVRDMSERVESDARGEA